MLDRTSPQDLRTSVVVEPSDIERLVTAVAEFVDHHRSLLAASHANA